VAGCVDVHIYMQVIPIPLTPAEKNRYLADRYQSEVFSIAGVGGHCGPNTCIRTT
jgi:hypothetical protein